jgi:hypothetical protein
MKGQCANFVIQCPFLRHWAKRESASGAQGSVDILTSMSEKEKGWTLYCDYVKKADV